MALDFNSGSVTPQRRGKDYTKKAQQPAAGGVPDAAPREPRPIGGQLLDMHRYEPGNWGEAIEAIEDFVGKGGGLGTLSKWAFENHVKAAEKDADALRNQRTQAFSSFKAISDETKKLQKKKQYDQAKQNRISDPWTRFFYYDSLAQDAKVESVLKYSDWGGKNLSRLSQIEDDSEIAIELANKAADLTAKYDYLPQTFKTNVVDSAMGQITAELKKTIVEKRLENSDLIANKTGKSKVLNGLRTMVTIIKTSKGGLTPQAQKAFETSVQDARGYLIQYYGGDEKKANEVLGEAFEKLYIDVDKPGDMLQGKNDVVEYAAGPIIQRALGEIKTKDGILLLDLRGKDGKSYREILESGYKSAYSLMDMAERANLAQMKRVSKEWTNNADITANQTLIDFEEKEGRKPEAAERQRMAEKHIEGLGVAGFTYSGKTGAEGQKYIYELYAAPVRVPTPRQTENFQTRVNRMSTKGEYLDSDFIAELRSWGLGNMVEENRTAVNKWRSGKYQSLRSTIISDLQTANKVRILGHESLATASKEGADGKAKLANADLAVEQSNIRLRDEAEEVIDEIIDNALKADPNALTSSKARREIYDEINRRLEGQAQYSDPNFYYNINLQDGNARGTQYNNVPDFSRTTKNRDGSWNIEILSLDNGNTWSSSAITGLRGDRTQTELFLNRQFIFNEPQMNELIRALTTNDMYGISQDTRDVMNNFEYATGGIMPMNEVVLQQVQRYTGNERLGPMWKANAKLLQGAFINYDAAPDDFTPYDVALSHNEAAGDYKSGLSTDGKQLNRVRFKLTRPTGQVGNDPMPAPVGGNIVDSGTHDTYGNYIIIKAEAHGPGYRKGDRIMISGGSRILVTSGRVSIGQQVMLTGGINGTTTGGLNPGQLQMTIFNPGEGFPARLDQKVQSHQVDFLQENVYPLIRRIK
jgi:hypothetical protein